MSEGVIIALISFFGTIISASIGAYATLKTIERNKAKENEKVNIKPENIVTEKQPSNQVRKLSYWKAIGMHLLFGFGLFYVDKTLNRKWLYPVFPLYALFDWTMAAVFNLKPFTTDEFGFATFGISLGIYVISFIDVVLTCRAKRQQFQ